MENNVYDVAYHFEQLNTDVCKTYLFYEDESNEAVIVDPKLDYWQAYFKLLNERNLKLKYILETHTHADHLSGAAALMDATGAKIVMHESSPQQCAKIRVKGGSHLQFGKIPIDVVYTPGHTKDSISYILPGKILTGDALFLDDGGAARDDLPGGSSSDHFETLQKLKKLSEELVVYPAHDYRERPNSSLAHQKKSNPHLQYKTKEEFIEYIESMKLGPAEWMIPVIKANRTCTRDLSVAEIPKGISACEVKGTLPPKVAAIKIPSITPENLKEKLDNKEDIVLVDVRDKKDLEGPHGKIDGVINIPINNVNTNLGELEQYKEKKIVFICIKGKKSNTAAQLAKFAGFKEPVILQGGMTKWHELFGKTN